MKFGKVIRKAIAACPPEWGDSWMDYKNFKLIIAEIEQEKKEKMEQLQKEDENATIDITSLEKEKQFFKQLTDSVLRVDTFFHQIQVQYIVEVKALIDEVKKIDDCPKEQLESTIEALLEKCRELHGKLLLLEMFAHVNYCGFTKITKKHDRMTGYITQKKFMQKKVNVTSFSSFTLLRNSVRIVEDQYIVLSKCLSHIKTIPPIKKSKEVKEVNDSLVELDRKVE
ncbi:hypothetical protein JH06_2856 [Blastocystis sp. subtype 4]|uniref:hypothetical protein n=1 Tax=Blastocystis sp. subtype 4 TaxID=944170 RepID=UPI000711F0B2|nr:hypothetical protein JH06_2856 [Blastocystis sp. subtype 4]KNB44752.1 hypothetical protein JH06_2856 [Blastocystis sp. subtype 4]|eukprot:XP_014528209.1 hypothetical protein JH06_2856 [Blastocystis sp. subtype 4]